MITAAARCIWVTASEVSPTASCSCVVRSTSASLCPASLPAAFVTMDVKLNSGRSVEIPRVEWHETVDKTAEDIVGDKRKPGPDSETLNECMEFIRAELRDGPKPAADMFKKGRAEGYSTATMKRAKKEMGVVSDRGK